MKKAQHLSTGETSAEAMILRAKNGWYVFLIDQCQSWSTFLMKEGRKALGKEGKRITGLQSIRPLQGKEKRKKSVNYNSS